MMCLMAGCMICALVMSGVALAETDNTVPDLYIKAINPGFTIDDKNNVGEMIEIGRRNSDDMVSLAGLTVRYTNSSGKDTVLFEFPENSYMAGEVILLRLASSPDSELAAINYNKTLAMSAGLALIKNDEVLDGVCWTGKDGCYKSFLSARPTTLVRDLETGLFEHLDMYEPIYDANSYYIDEVISEEEKKESSQCRQMGLSEVYSYYESTKDEQFIELYNNGSEQVLLDGCRIRYKNKEYGLSGIVKPEEYYVYYPTGFNLTKNPVNSNKLELIDVDGQVVDEMNYPNGQRRGASYAMIGYDEWGREIWRATYGVTPGGGNSYQEFKTCEAGKVINETTGNCVKITTITEKVCKDGYYLNPLTGRCKKNETAEVKTCKEGYYLNPETGRCRKIVQNNSADYNIKPEEYEEKSSFAALYAVIVVTLMGIGYLVFEFRHQIVRFGKRMIGR